ncbi:MAG: hypothetical protein IKY91_01575, partial [Akkermansia sp.]|nr:hypothetical protein [Akkermansia sp.]
MFIPPFIVLPLKAGVQGFIRGSRPGNMYRPTCAPEFFEPLFSGYPEGHKGSAPSEPPIYLRGFPEICIFSSACPLHPALNQPVFQPGQKKRAEKDF